MSDNWLYDQLLGFRNWAYQQPDIGVGDFTLHSGADFLLEAYKVASVDLGDVQVLQHQRDALNQMLNEGIGLHQHLQDGADTLRGVWTSPTAATYLPAPTTAFSIEHDIPQSTMGGIALTSTGNVLTSFQHNAAVHDQWATDNQALIGVRDEVMGILRDVVISIGVDLAIQWIPVVDLVGDGGEVAFLAWRFGRLGELINTFQNLSQVWRLLAIITVVNALDPAHPLTTGLITDLHTLTLPASVTVTGGGTLQYNPTKNKLWPNPNWEAPGVQQAAEELLKDLAKIAAGVLGAADKALMQYLIAWLMALGYTTEQAKTLLLCMAQRGWLIETTAKAQAWTNDYASIWKTIKDNLEPDDIQGAWRDENGIPVVVNGKSYWHLEKVLDALRGLTNRLSNPLIPTKFKQAIQQLIDWVNGKVYGTDPPQDWADKGVNPFLSDTLKASGCL